jgi:glutamate synthase (NADPH/NADH) small chain
VAVQGSEFVLNVDLVIEALGEQPESLPAEALVGVRRTRGGLIQVDPRTQATTRAGVYAAGDCANGGTTVVQAVAEGLRAARAACRFLG